MKNISLTIFLLFGLSACTSATEMKPTSDPIQVYVDANSSQATAVAAIATAEYHAGQLTATAEAPIVAITQTAAAFQMELMFTSATAASVSATETMAVTQTAAAWTPTHNATMTAVFVASAAEATHTANQIELSNLQVERARVTNFTRAISIYTVGFALLIVAMAWGIGLARKHSVYAVPTNEQGDKAAIVLDGVVMDVDRLPNGVGQLTGGFVKQLPPVTAERQDVVTAHDQMIDLKARTRVTSAAVDRLLKSQGLGNSLPAPAANQLAASTVSDDDLNLPLPPWEFITRWDVREPLPLGFGRNGLITARAASPHILVAGKTGSRKTRGMLRPLTAASLAKGYLVFNLGYSQAGFGVFDSHPNYYTANISDPRDILEGLTQVYDEHKARKALIGNRDLEWEHWGNSAPPRPFLMLLVDELEMLSEDLYQGYSKGADLCSELWSLTARIVKEGRKTGIYFTGALQDGTGKSIDLRFRRNCTLVTFQLGDPSHSNAFIGTAGADKLTEGHFMARTDGLQIGGAFMPTDAEIAAFLNRSTMKPMEPPKWIEGVARSVERQIEEPKQEQLPPIVQPRDEIAEMAEQIRAQWDLSMSKTKTAKLLGFPQYGGAYTGKVDRVIEYLISTTPVTTTTEKQPEIGNLEKVEG